MLLRVFLVLLWTFCGASTHSAFRKPLAVVIGRSGGIAETISYHLLREDMLAGVLLKRGPHSPLLSRMLPKELLFNSSSSLVGRLGGRKMSTNDGKVMILCPDPGDADDITKQLIAQMADWQNHVSSVVEIVCDGGGPARTNKEKTVSITLQTMCARMKLPLLRIAASNIIGDIPGLEPLPFVGMPTLEPELHPSYANRAVSCVADGRGAGRQPNQQAGASESVCTHEAVSTLALQLLRRCAEGMVFSTSPPNHPQALRLTSIPGTPPTQAEWDAILTKALLPDASQRELLSVAFQEVLRPQALMSWVSDTWYPQAMIDINAAVATSGARPVRITRDGADGLSLVIVWEELRPDLTITRVGELRIDVSLGGVGTNPCLTVTRGAGTVLPGDAQLAEHLQNALSNNVYRKQICKELAVART